MTAMSSPLNNEVTAALGRFFIGGDGPSHPALTRTFVVAGFASDDPYDGSTPTKEKRVLAVCDAARRRTPDSARRLTDELLTAIRVDGGFVEGAEGTITGADVAPRVRALREAFARAGWSLSESGVLSSIGAIDIETGGRAALDEQLARIRSQTDDPGGLIGSAKDLVESVLKFVLERVGIPPQRMNFPALLNVAAERLAVRPQDVDAETAAGRYVREIYQSAYRITENIANLRNLEGAGHGRTLPTGVSPETAFFVVREACVVADFYLSTLDRKYGRQD
jgi:hypothetical protein